MSGSPLTALPAAHSGIASWPLRTHLELAALPTAAACTRGLVRALTMEWGLPNLTDAAELLASELVTNAIQASRELMVTETPIVRIWIASDGVSMVIHVWDASAAMPVRQQAGPGDDSGRGLMIIDALSADWGTYREADGKVVWALIRPDS
jgi:anti-sigma regulatory factor (Ser/Thr protein kinase)